MGFRWVGGRKGLSQNGYGQMYDTYMIISNCPDNYIICNHRPSLQAQGVLDIGPTATARGGALNLVNVNTTVFCYSPQVIKRPATKPTPPPNIQVP